VIEHRAILTGQWGNQPAHLCGHGDSRPARDLTRRVPGRRQNGAAPTSPKPSAEQDCLNRGFHWVGGKCADKKGIVSTSGNFE